MAQDLQKFIETRMMELEHDLRRTQEKFAITGPGWEKTNLSYKITLLKETLQTNADIYRNLTGSSHH